MAILCPCRQNKNKITLSSLVVGIVVARELAGTQRVTTWERYGAKKCRELHISNGPIQPTALSPPDLQSHSIPSDVRKDAGRNSRRETRPATFCRATLVSQPCAHFRAQLLATALLQYTREVMLYAFCYYGSWRVWLLLRARKSQLHGI